MIIKIFFCVFGSIRRYGTKKFWIFDHFWEIYGPSQKRILPFFVFWQKCFFFRGCDFCVFLGVFLGDALYNGQKWSKTHENLFFPTLVITLGKNKILWIFGHFWPFYGASLLWWTPIWGKMKAFQAEIPSFYPKLESSTQVMRCRMVKNDQNFTNICFSREYH